MSSPIVPHHRLLALLALCFLASSVSAAAWDLTPPTPPTIPDLPAIPGTGATDSGSSSAPAEQGEKKPSYIYQIYGGSGSGEDDITLNFKKLSEEQLTRIIAKAKAQIPDEASYQDKKSEPHRLAGSVNALKGFILEELYFTYDDYRSTFAQCKRVAEQEGIDPGLVFLARDAFGRMPKVGDAANGGAGITPAQRQQLEAEAESWSDLTDGMVVAVLHKPLPGTSAEAASELAAFTKLIRSYGPEYAIANAAGGELHDYYVRILAVFESKTSGENRALTHEKGGGDGQVKKDYRRLRSYPLVINGEVFTNDQIIIDTKGTGGGAVRGTSWTLVLPRGFQQAIGKTPSATKGLFSRLNGTLEEFDFRLNEGPVSDNSAKIIAENVFHCLYEKDLFSAILPRTEE